LINEEIKAKEVRVVGPDGAPMGILSIKDALRAAQESKLDLVNVAPQAKPPVCRIMDYGKFRYEQSKREKEARKNQKVINVKELRMSPTTEEHDQQVRIKRAKEFLNDGDKVKISIRFKGRQITHTELAEKILENFAEKLSDIATVEKKAKLEGRNMTVLLAPKVSK
jgi:translation initiation factor IF-3